jgi:predicted exporter
MTTRQSSELLIARDEIVAPPTSRACGDQSFELPSAIYLAMSMMFIGFIGVLALAFHTHTGLSFAVIFALIGTYFTIPALFPRMAPNRARALGWFEFMDRGISTATGRASARDATILVLLLPFLILCFGIAVATIAALVR